MLQLKNTTPFPGTLANSFGLDGEDVLLIAIKGTFALLPQLAIAEEQKALHMADVYHGSPGRSSVRYPADLHLSKLATDVLLNACARSRDGKPVAHLDVSLAIGDREKRVRVIGDRIWNGGRLGAAMSAPKPFTTMPLKYEQAFGGYDAKQDPALCAPNNPVGVGLVNRSLSREGTIAGLPLPNIEDPQHPLTQPGQRVPVVGFSAIAPSWQPRVKYCGTYDETWQRTRMPFLPSDFDRRFFQVAPQDQIQRGHLHGGEPVRIENMAHEGTLAFNLPTCQIEAVVHIDGAVERPPLQLGTVVIDTEERRLMMTWQATVSCEKRLLRIRQVDLQMQRLAIYAPFRGQR